MLERISREHRAAFHSLVMDGPNKHNLLVLIGAEWLPPTFRRLIASKYSELATRDGVAASIARLGIKSKEKAWLELGAAEVSRDEQ